MNLGSVRRKAKFSIRKAPPLPLTPYPEAMVPSAHQRRFNLLILLVCVLNHQLGSSVSKQRLDFPFLGLQSLTQLLMPSTLKVTQSAKEPGQDQSQSVICPINTQPPQSLSQDTSSIREDPCPPVGCFIPCSWQTLSGPFEEGEREGRVWPEGPSFTHRGNADMPECVCVWGTSGG